MLCRPGLKTRALQNRGQQQPAGGRSSRGGGAPRERAGVGPRPPQRNADRTSIVIRLPLPDRPVIDDADNRGVGRWLDGIERKGGLAAAYEEHVLADAGADRVERDQRAAGRVARG